MVKGVNRQIIEIKSTESEIFERALLFVRAGQEIKSKNELNLEAAEYLEEMEKSEDGQGIKPAAPVYIIKNRRLLRAVRLLTAAFLVTAAAFVVLLLVYTKM